MASTVLPNGIIVPEKFSRDWYADLYHNWQELDNLLGGGTPKDGTLTIQKNGDTVGTFSANQATDETVNIEVPDVNNGTLTIQQNGTTVDSFSANSSSDKTVNIQCVDLTNNQTVAGNKEFTGTTTAHDLVPSATETYNFGSSSYQWNNAYIKSLTINGVACGDILTHNVSEFVNLTGAQTIGGVKTFSDGLFASKSTAGDLVILEDSSINSTNEDANGMPLTGHTNSIKIKGSQYNVIPCTLTGQLFASGNTSAELRVYKYKDVNSRASLNIYYTYTNDRAEVQFINCHLATNISGAYDIGSFARRFGTAYISALNINGTVNGINPGALSLPSNSYVNVDTTGWDLTCQNELMGSFTPTADGWLMLHVANSGTNEVNFWIIGGVIRINNKSTLNDNNDNFNMITIPVEKDKTYNIYGNASEYVAGRSIAYCRFMPCRGNV